MYEKYEKLTTFKKRRKHVVTPLIGTVKPLRQWQKLEVFNFEILGH